MTASLYIRRRPAAALLLGLLAALLLLDPAREASAQQLNFRTTPPSTSSPAVEETERDDIFLRAEPSTRSVYAGEEVVVEYQLFFREPLRPRGSRLSETSTAEGLWQEELEIDMRPEPTARSHDGQRYHMIVLKRVAFFPTRPGSFTLSPMSIQTEVDTRRGSSYGRRSADREVELTSSALEMEAHPLPEDAPSSFRGAVGDYRIEAEVSERRAEVDQALEIDVRVEGAGNLALLAAPSLEVGGGAELMGPRTKTELDRSGASLRGVKSFTYTLIPREAGALELPEVSFTYFNPATGRFHTAEHALSEVTVAERSTPIAEDRSSQDGGISTWLSRVTGGLLAFLTLAGLTFAAYRLATGVRHSPAEKPSSVNEATLERARQQLQIAAQARRASDAQSFFRGVEAAVLCSIAPFLQQASEGLSRLEIRRQLEASAVPEQLTGQVLELLEACDRAQYSPVKHLDAEHILRRTRTVVNTLARHRPDRPHTHTAS